MKAIMVDGQSRRKYTGSRGSIKMTEHGSSRITEMRKYIVAHLLRFILRCLENTA